MKLNVVLINVLNLGNIITYILNQDGVHIALHISNKNRQA